MICMVCQGTGRSGKGTAAEGVCTNCGGLGVLPGHFKAPGCICPPTSEQTCMNLRCPRKEQKYAGSAGANP
jgi:hypothetical protein